MASRLKPKALKKVVKLRTQPNGPTAWSLTKKSIETIINKEKKVLFHNRQSTSYIKL